MTLSYCGDTVRKHDPDRFLLSLFAPPAKREALWALYAFNHEISRTRAVVTETRLGLIRLQWWRDAVGGIYGGTPPAGNPVVDALARAVKEYGLPHEPLDALIYAREFDLEDRLPADMAGLVNYADFISMPLMNLSAVILSTCEGSPCYKQGRSFASAQDDSVKNTAIAYALTSILRATPALLRQRRCYLPEDLLKRAGADPQDLYEGRGVEKMREVVEEVARAARAKLPAAPANRFLRLHATLARMYLNQIEAARYDLFSPRLAVPPFAREIRLAWAGLF